MDNQSYVDFARGQIEWHEKQNAFCRRQIDWCNRDIKRTRAHDKEIAEYALSCEPDNPLTVKIFGGKYISDDTRKLMNERAKYYREIKYNNKRIEHFKKQVEQYSLNR